VSALAFLLWVGLVLLLLGTFVLGWWARGKFNKLMEKA
jgi:hypothetical protein